jgi:uncharacterized membrane protein
MMTRFDPDAIDQQYNTDNPALSNVLERNIRTILRLRAQADRSRSIQDRIADTITNFSGHLVFVYVHILWFGGWILVNTGSFGVKPFDPFPYGLLTMVVSLEAIFLSTFVLISQNRLGEDAENRANLNLQIALLTENEVTRVLQMLDTIQDKMGIENDQDKTLLDLEKDIRPEDVLAEIHRLQQLSSRRNKQK